MDRVIEKNKWNKQKIVLFIVVILFIYFLIYLFFINDSLNTYSIEKTTIKIDSVRKGEFLEYVFVEGLIQPKTTILIDATVGGKIEEIRKEDAAWVKKGDIILKLSNPSLELDYMNRETQMYDIINNLQNTKMNLEKEKFTKEKEVVELTFKIDKASKDFEIKEILFNEKVIPKQEFDDCKREFSLLIKQRDIAIRQQKQDSIYNIIQISQIKSSIDRMSNNLVLLKKNLDNLYVRAPIDGKLNGFTSEVGEIKNPGETIAYIDAAEGIKIKSQIDEFYINKLQIDQKAVIKIQAVTYNLKISKISSKISQGRCELEFLFVDNYPKNLRKGQSFPIQINFSESSMALMIPKGNFYQNTSGNWIFVVNEASSSATKKKITIGRQNAEFYEVLEGLDVGEKIIISKYDDFENKKKLILK